MQSRPAVIIASVQPKSHVTNVWKREIEYVTVLYVSSAMIQALLVQT
jgi:hypothetical protein